MDPQETPDPQGILDYLVPREKEELREILAFRERWVLWDHQELQDLLETGDTLDHQVKMDLLDLKDRGDQSDHLERRDLLVCRDLLGHQDQPVSLVQLDQKDRWVPKETWVRKVKLVYPDLQDQRVPGVIQEVQDRSDHQDRMEIRENLDHQDPEDRKVNTEKWAHQDLKDLRVSWDQWDHLVLLGNQAYKVSRDLLDTRALKVHVVFQVHQD